MKKLIAYFYLKSKFNNYLAKHKPSICSVPEEKFTYKGTQYSIEHKHTGDTYDTFGYFTELINQDKNRVVFRKGKSTKSLDNMFCRWTPTKQTFFENI